MKITKIFIWALLFIGSISYWWGCQPKPCTGCINGQSTPVSNFTPCDKSIDQEIKTADVAIESLTVDTSSNPEEMTLEVTVKNRGDDDADQIRLLVLLPVETDVISFASSDPDVTSRQCRGYVEYSWEKLGKGDQPNCCKTFTISTGRFNTCERRAICRNGRSLESFSAFVVSQIPDMDKTNNYRVWEAGCMDDVSDASCPYPFLQHCREPVFGEGLIKIIGCPGNGDHACFFPVDVEKACLISSGGSKCPWCDVRSLCKGDMLMFGKANDFKVTLYLVEEDLNGKAIMEAMPKNGTLTLVGNELTQGINPNQKLVAVLQNINPITETVEMPITVVAAK